MRKARLLAFLGVSGAVLAFGACGSRTGLLVDEPFETPPDVTDDRRDGGRDAADARDAVRDSPGLDVPIKPDVDRRDCPDAAATLVYLINTSYELFSLYPPTMAFNRIGAIACPQPPGSTATPFSMAVDRTGIARVLFNDGRLYRVSTATAACQTMAFAPGQQGFQTFGMGYASDTNGPSESLFVAGDGAQAASRGLAVIELVNQNYVLRPIGPFSSAITRAELTGTGAGGLFAFYEQNGESFIGQIDKTNARVIGETPLPEVTQGQGWAFAFWGGDFYTFTAPNGTTEIHRYRPSDNSVVRVGRHTTMFVGAGVSTCAPQ